MLFRVLLGPDSERLNASFRAALDPVDEELLRIIAEHRGAPDLEQREDILSLLLRARDPQGEGLTDGELRDELMTLLLAGHETTATTLSWVFERITRHPDVLARVTEESLAGGEAPYTDAVIQETLRVRPVLPLVARIVTRPITVGQGRFRLPAGHARRAGEHPRPLPRRHLPRAARVPARALPRRAARAPTRGSRSAAACGAASARRSRSSRRGP